MSVMSDVWNFNNLISYLVKIGGGESYPYPSWRQNRPWGESEPWQRPYSYNNSNWDNRFVPRPTMPVCTPSYRPQGYRPRNQYYNRPRQLQPSTSRLHTSYNSRKANNGNYSTQYNDDYKCHISNDKTDNKNRVPEKREITPSIAQNSRTKIQTDTFKNRSNGQKFQPHTKRLTNENAVVNRKSVDLNSSDCSAKNTLNQMNYSTISKKTLATSNCYNHTAEGRSRIDVSSTTKSIDKKTDLNNQKHDEEKTTPILPEKPQTIVQTANSNIKTDINSNIFKPDESQPRTKLEDVDKTANLDSACTKRNPTQCNFKKKISISFKSLNENTNNKIGASCDLPGQGIDLKNETEPITQITSKTTPTAKTAKSSSESIDIKVTSDCETTTQTNSCTTLGNQEVSTSADTNLRLKKNVKIIKTTERPTESKSQQDKKQADPNEAKEIKSSRKADMVADVTRSCDSTTKTMSTDSRSQSSEALSYAKPDSTSDDLDDSGIFKEMEDLLRISSTQYNEKKSTVNKTIKKTPSPNCSSSSGEEQMCIDEDPDLLILGPWTERKKSPLASFKSEIVKSELPTASPRKAEPKPITSDNRSEFENIDTAMSYMNTFKQLFDDVRPVDMDLCETPPPDVLQETTEITSSPQIDTVWANANVKIAFPDSPHSNSTPELIRDFSSKKKRSTYSTDEDGSKNEVKDRAKKKCYVTKAEFDKAFTGTKQKMSSSLLKPLTNISKVHKRRSTFTDESDTATMLRKIKEEENKKKLFLLFGSSSDEEDDSSQTIQCSSVASSEKEVRKDSDLSGCERRKRKDPAESTKSSRKKLKSSDRRSSLDSRSSTKSDRLSNDTRSSTQKNPSSTVSTKNNRSSSDKSKSTRTNTDAQPIGTKSSSSKIDKTKQPKVDYEKLKTTTINTGNVCGNKHKNSEPKIEKKAKNCKTIKCHDRRHSAPESASVAEIVQQSQRQAIQNETMINFETSKQLIIKIPRMEQILPTKQAAEDFGTASYTVADGKNDSVTVKQEKEIGTTLPAPVVDLTQDSDNSPAKVVPPDPVVEAKKEIEDIFGEVGMVTLYRDDEHVDDSEVQAISAMVSTNKKSSITDVLKKECELPDSTISDTLVPKSSESVNSGATNNSASSMPLIEDICDRLVPVSSDKTPKSATKNTSIEDIRIEDLLEEEIQKTIKKILDSSVQSEKIRSYDIEAQKVYLNQTRIKERSSTVTTTLEIKQTTKEPTQKNQPKSPKKDVINRGISVSPPIQSKKPAGDMSALRNYRQQFKEIRPKIVESNQPPTQAPNCEMQKQRPSIHIQHVPSSGSRVSDSGTQVQHSVEAYSQNQPEKQALSSSGNYEFSNGSQKELSPKVHTSNVPAKPLDATGSSSVFPHETHAPSVSIHGTHASVVLTQGTYVPAISTLGNQIQNPRGAIQNVCSDQLTVGSISLPSVVNKIQSLYAQNRLSNQPQILVPASGDSLERYPHNALLNHPPKQMYPRNGICVSGSGTQNQHFPTGISCQLQTNLHVTTGPPAVSSRVQISQAARAHPQFLDPNQLQKQVQEKQIQQSFGISTHNLQPTSTNTGTGNQNFPNDISSQPQMNLHVTTGRPATSSRAQVSQAQIVPPNQSQKHVHVQREQIQQSFGTGIHNVQPTSTNSGTGNQHSSTQQFIGPPPLQRLPYNANAHTINQLKQQQQKVHLPSPLDRSHNSLSNSGNTNPNQPSSFTEHLSNFTPRFGNYGMAQSQVSKSLPGPNTNIPSQNSTSATDKTSSGIPPPPFSRTSQNTVRPVLSPSLCSISTIISKQIYILAHLYQAQRAYTDTLGHPAFQKHIFEKEVEVFENYKSNCAARRSFELLQLLQPHMDETSELHQKTQVLLELRQKTQLLLDHIYFLLCQVDMPGKPIPRSVMYSLLADIIRPKTSMYLSYPLLAEVIRQLGRIELNTISGFFTTYMRQTLSSQIHAHNRLLSMNVGLRLEKRQPVRMMPPQSVQRHLHTLGSRPYELRAGDLPGGANTTSLGSTPRYVPNQELRPTPSREQSNELLKEILDLSSTSNPFGRPKDDFLIKLPFSKPNIAPASNTSTFTSSAMPTLIPTSPEMNNNHANDSITDNEGGETHTANGSRSPVVLNQGIQALAAIGTTELMLQASPSPDINSSGSSNSINTGRKRASQPQCGSAFKKPRQEEATATSDRVQQAQVKPESSADTNENREVGAKDKPITANQNTGEKTRELVKIEINREEEFTIEVCQTCYCGMVAEYTCKCDNIWYCGDSCQRKDWPSHRIHCKITQE